MSLPPDLVEMLSVFADSGVRYLVIGGHAVSLHARPRTTKDLDLWLDAAPENIGRACAALLRFGVPAELVADLREARPDEIVWMGRVPARVDFLQRVPGLDFEVSWERRVTVDVAGVPVQFIGRNDLLENKRVVGRPQDLRDVRAIERAVERDARGRGSTGRKAAKPVRRKR
jgi:predicted nucleotidyltransferase